jgi:hypothetical protein
MQLQGNASRSSSGPLQVGTGALSDVIVPDACISWGSAGRSMPSALPSGIIANSMPTRFAPG